MPIICNDDMKIPFDSDLLSITSEVPIMLSMLLLGISYFLSEKT